jgi:hypothetical protein
LVIGCIDEAHVIKNKETAANVSYEWLCIPFTILATASILPNRKDDLAGFVKFMTKDHDENGVEYDSRESMFPLDAMDSISLFLVPDEHSVVLGTPADGSIDMGLGNTFIQSASIHIQY